MNYDEFRALETATTEQRAELVRRLAENHHLLAYFIRDAEEEISRRLRTMTPENLVNAVCDILRESSLTDKR